MSSPDSSHPAPHQPLGRSMRQVGNLLITISAITPAASVFVIGQQVIQQAGTGAIICFLAAGLLALMTAFVYAELSSAFPITGAEYTMMGRTMGPTWGFMALGLNLFGTPVSQAVTALGLADYLAVVIPGLPALPVALAVTVATALVGVLNVRLNAKITGIFLLVELGALAVMTALGFLHAHNSLSELVLRPVAPTAAGTLAPVTWAAVGLGMTGAIYAYNGYGGACYFGEEMFEARTKVAWVIFGSLAVGGAAIFLPVLAVLMGAPDLKAVLTAEAPFPAFLLAAGGKVVDQVVSLGVAFAIVNAMIAIGLINARQLFCSGRDGVWPGPLSRWAAAVHPRFHSPWIASLVMGAVTLVCCFIPLEQLVILSGANIALLYAGVSVAVIVGRRNGTTAVGHYRMPLYPLWPIAALIGIAGALFAAALDPAEGRPGLVANAAVMAVSAAYYLFYLKRRGGWALRGADGKTLEELEDEALASGAEGLMSAPP